MSTVRFDAKSNLIAAAALAALSTTSYAAIGTWEFDASGDWNTSTAAPWVSDIVAEGSDNTAFFNGVNLTANRTVALTAPLTIGNLYFGDTDVTTGFGWTLNNNSNAANILTLAGTAPTITVDALGVNAGTQAVVTISSVIMGSSGLTKNGNGTTTTGVLVLTGANTYTGGTTINTGSLRAAASSLAGTGTITVANGARLQLNGGTFANTMNINGSSALFGQNQSGNAIVSGTVNLQTSSGVNMNTNANASLEFSGTINLSDKTFTLQPVGAASPISVTGTVNGTGGITKASSGTLTISNNNTGYSGTTTLQTGAIAVGHNGALGSGAIQLGLNTDTTGTFRSTDATARTFSNALSLTTGNGNSVLTFGAASGGTGDLTFSGPVTLSGVRRVVISSKTTFDGNVGGAGGILMQTGTNTLILNGTNNYSNTTTVSAGTLLVNGTNSGAGAFSVTAGTLGGTGSIASAVTVGNSTGVDDSILSPGSLTTAIESLNTGALSFANDGVFTVQLNSNLLSSDSVASSAGITLGNGLALLQLSDLGSTTLAPLTTFTLMTSVSPITGYFRNLAPVNNVGPEVTLGSNQFRLDYGTNAVTLTVVPEPTALAMIGLLSLPAMLRRRSRS